MFRGSLGVMNDVILNLFKEHAAEAFRECAILWLVFSLLDRTIAGQLTVTWTWWNFSGSIAVWTIGMYIEVKRKR